MPKRSKIGYLLVEVESQSYTENILQMKTFHATMCVAYPLEKLNSLKGVIRSRELSLATAEEIRAALVKQCHWLH